MAPIATGDVNHEVVSRSLHTLHLNRLNIGDIEERKNLLLACQTQGFFYLDLTSDQDLCKQWEDLLLVMKQYFTQPLEIKMQDAKGSDNHGYEPVGTEPGPKPKSRDGYESLKISRREFLQGHTDLSTSISSQSDLFFSFIHNAHSITLTILKQLSLQLGLSGPSSFESYHEDPGPSLSTLGLLRYPKHDHDVPLTSVGHNKHTDVGSLTLLLTQQWGLQFLSPETNRWELLEPRPGHAIVNVGDSLRFPSKSELSSVVHRVIPIKGVQDVDRYSIAYFLRLNDDVTFNDSTGKTWTARGWHNFKFDVFKSPSTLDVTGQFLTGMMEENDRLVGNSRYKTK